MSHEYGGVRNTETPEPQYQRPNSKSPSRNELVHMRPSNLFEEISEEQFNRREQDKAAYKHELQSQINAAKNRKAEQKRLKQLEDIKEEQKILS
jgi:hypothetical protein